MPSGEHSRLVSYFHHWTKVGPSAKIQNASVALAYLLLELQTVHFIFCCLQVPDYVELFEHIWSLITFCGPLIIGHRCICLLSVLSCVLQGCRIFQLYSIAILAEQEQTSPCCMLIFLCVVFLFYPPPPCPSPFLSFLHRYMLTSPQIHPKEFNNCDNISAWVINGSLWSPISSCSATHFQEFWSCHPFFFTVFLQCFSFVVF